MIRETPTAASMIAAAGSRAAGFQSMHAAVLLAAGVVLYAIAALSWGRKVFATLLLEAALTVERGE